jgi:hypothetical protein
MNPEAKALIAAYKSGQLPVDRFLQGMNRLGYSDSAATSALVDYEVETQRAARAQGATQTEPSATPTQTPPAATPTPTAGVTPQYDIQPGYHSPRAEEGPVPGFYAPQRIEEDRATRARLSDLPSDFGSPTGSMAYPSQLPANLQPSTVQQAVNVAKSIPQREASNTQTTGGGPSALAALIRGRFGEAAQGNAMDDRLTAFQEARDRSGEARASGGEVSAKAPNNRDAALHKALEIIQHLLTRS